MNPQPPRPWTIAVYDHPNGDAEYIEVIRFSAYQELQRELDEAKAEVEFFKRLVDKKDETLSDYKAELTEARREIERSNDKLCEELDKQAALSYSMGKASRYAEIEVYRTDNSFLEIKLKESEESNRELRERLEVAREALKRIVNDEKIVASTVAREILQKLAAESCICGEINARNCPVHQVEQEDGK